MIQEVDTALRDLVRREIGSDDVDVVFDAPTRDWAARRSVPTVNLFLYDIREDVSRRSGGLVALPGHDDQVVGRTTPPRWFKLSYLVTAWTQRPEDEHRLLSALLGCFLGFDSIPPDLLGGVLGRSDARLPLTAALPPPKDRAFADVWSALGGELKPSLDVATTVPIATGQRFDAGPPVQEPLRIGIGGSAGWPAREEAVGPSPSRVAPPQPTPPQPTPPRPTPPTSAAPRGAAPIARVRGRRRTPG